MKVRITAINYTADGRQDVVADRFFDDWLDPETDVFLTECYDRLSYGVRKLDEEDMFLQARSSCKAHKA